MDQKKLPLLEASLFMATEPLSMEELKKITGSKEEEIREMIEILMDKYNTNPASGILISFEGGYRMLVKPEYIRYVRHLSPYADLSRGLLRTLAIVAYHEPVRQSDIVKIVGNRAYEYIKELESRGLVRTEKASRTKVVTTTENFEKYFGITRDELKRMVGGHNERDDIPRSNEDGGEPEMDGGLSGEKSIQPEEE